MHATPEGDAEPAPELLSLLLPLHFFYEREGRQLPPVELLDGADVPEPQRSLLVHSRDMTSTLRNFPTARRSPSRCRPSSAPPTT